MAFNSLAFALFLPIVFLIYWRARRSSVQNVVLLAASYVFYGWWDWRFLALILLTTASSFLLALPERRRELCLTANIVLNISILGVFKYYNFFSQSLSHALGLMGIHTDWPLLDALLPVGISFYTFQAISYSVDVYRRTIAPCRNPLHFATFIAFFPQLVAGPIERASTMLPQFA
ncbi:MAG: MBOAT family protein, partial [Muribaculaceae bacterium]